MCLLSVLLLLFFFNDTATTEIYTLSLHDALPISSLGGGIDIGSDLGLLINGGVDIPISRAFTLNSQINWRVTEDTGLGLSLGVAYNFPVFFE